jgi:hypothetical protein
MNLLEKEILNYEKKGFKVLQKRTLKYGSRIFLKKEEPGFIFSSFKKIYLYYIDGDSTTDSFRECFKDYVKCYEEQEFGEGDKGFFLCSGSIDEKLFKDLRKAIISDEDIRNSVKVIGLGKEEIEKVPAIKKTRKIIGTAEEIEPEIPKLENILEKIKRFVPHEIPKKEKELGNMLIHYLSAFYPNIATQMTYEKATIDAQIGKIGIEIKYQPSASELDRLYGQIDKYCKYFDKVVVVIGYEKSRENTESFRERLRARNWLNNKVFLITIR